MPAYGLTFYGIRSRGQMVIGVERLVNHLKVQNKHQYISVVSHRYLYSKVDAEIKRGQHVAPTILGKDSSVSSLGRKEFP